MALAVPTAKNLVTFVKLVQTITYRHRSRELEDNEQNQGKLKNAADRRRHEGKCLGFGKDAEEVARLRERAGGPFGRRLILRAGVLP